ncbi:MAG TPA: acyl-CoA dehydrogenase family protein [Jatrophihabitantaceae bacterium]
MIDLAENEDQAEIARTAARLLSERDDPPWQACAELGWLALAVPERYGGVGYRLAEQVVLFRELGRALASAPFLGTVLAVELAMAAGDTVRLSALVSGTERVALGEPARGHGEWRIWSDGTPVGSVLLVDDSGRCRLVDGDQVQTVETTATIDPAYQLRIACIDEGVGLAVESAAITGRGAVLAAAMLVGIAERARDESVRYAVDRVQYGRPIGSFQAVKHRCADMAVRAEAAWALTGLAAVELDAGRPEAALDVTAASVIATSAALTNARDNIQNHGAMGFTDEHSAHRYLKRAHVLGAQFATPSRRVERLLAAANPW